MTEKMKSSGQPPSLTSKSGSFNPEDCRQDQLVSEVELEMMIAQAIDSLEILIDMIPINRQEFFKKELARIKRLQEVENTKLIWGHLSPGINQ